METDKHMDLSKLKEKMTYKWRVQSSSQWNTTLVGYIDARDVEDLLDEVCRPENWCNVYTMVSTQMMCGIGININNQWVFKYDGGSESNVEKNKGLLSDSFKRAAVKWGIGRFLYRLVPFKLASMDSGRKDRNDNPVYVPMHDVTKHGAAKDVPFGILGYNGKTKQQTLAVISIF